MSDKIVNLDQLGRAHACGHKKESVARVWVSPGQGTFKIRNFKGEFLDYFKRESLVKTSLHGLLCANILDKYDVECTLSGGGLSSQAQALMYGIVKAVLSHDDSHKPLFRSLGLLTRDSRVVERKKYGRAKARRSFQFSKR